MGALLSSRDDPLPICRSAPSRVLGPPPRAKSKMPRPSRKNSRFSGKNRLNRVRFTCCLVHLNLAKSVFQVRSAVRLRGDAVLDVHPVIAAAVVAARRVHREVGGDPGNAVRLDLEVGAAVRHVETHQQRGVGQAEEAPATRRDRHRRDVRHLVLRRIVRRICTPHRWTGPRPVAQRPERNRHLHRPAALEPAGADVPHRVPVAVGIALVRDPEVADRPQRVGCVEGDPVAPVVEGVERDPERVVLAKLGGVAPHLVRHPLAGRRRVPDPPPDVDVRLVEQDSTPRSSRSPGAFHRHLLNEVGDRGHRAVHRLVEPAVEAEAGGEADRADRRPALRIPRDHRRRAGRGRRSGRPASANPPAPAAALPGACRSAVSAAAGVPGAAVPAGPWLGGPPCAVADTGAPASNSACTTVRSAGVTRPRRTTDRCVRADARSTPTRAGRAIRHDHAAMPSS